MSHPGNPEKAKRYLSLLDEARCNGKWSEVPELARKVGKHAPWRKCLVLTAQAESEVALSTTQRPSTASSMPNRSSRPALHEAISNEKTYPEDIYQARICLAAGYLSTGEKESAVAALPENFPPLEDNNTIESKKDFQGWTYICSVKGAFLGDLCQGSANMADVTNAEILEHLSTIPMHIKRTSEYSFWAEKLLMRLCTSLHKKPKAQQPERMSVEETLAPYRSWASFWEDQSSRGSATERAPELNDKRRRIWWDYYKTISKLLQDGYSYPLPETTAGDDAEHIPHTPRIAQSSEIRKVEHTYEGLLLKDIPFPEASEVNSEVDDWADQLMANWSVTCGPSWQDDDLGEGGQEAASRNVLDMLYRAASRTFQSNTILRHLTTVHASLGDFGLAARALDSYVEIVTKGRIRAEKSGKPEPGLDTEESMLETIAYGIPMLCKYGQLKEATRAEELSISLCNFLTSHANEVPDGTNTEEMSAHTNSPPKVSAEVIALCHKAVAISKATWAQYTLESSERSDLQNTAIHHLRQALMANPKNEDDPSVLYALSLILAETRDIDGAIATMKHALNTQIGTVEETDKNNADLSKLHNRVLAKVGLTQCWHLIALLLSSRQDYEKAEVCCETAAHIFDDDVRLPGELELKKLSILEKQNVVEAKMTAIALSEITDGPEVAVNAGGQLLELYTRIFESPEKVIIPSSRPIDRRPNTATGHRSLRESIFGKRDHRTSIRESTATTPAFNNRQSTETTRPPTIAINDNEYIPPPTSHSNHPPSRKPSNRLQKRPSQKSLRRSRGNSPARTASTKKPARLSVDGTEETGRPSRHRRGSSASQPYEIGLAFSEDIPEKDSALTALPQINTDRLSEKPSLPQPQKAKESELRRPIFDIITPKFSKSVQDRHSLSVLSQIWIFIAGVYRRAKMLEDADGALQEAVSLTGKVEVLAAEKNSSAREFERRCDSGSKSVNELYADAYAEHAELLLAQDQPYEAMLKFELALSFYPDHPDATVGLSNILLDIYMQKIPLQPKEAQIADDYIKTPVKDESSLPLLSNINPPTARPPLKSDNNSETFPVFEEDEHLEKPKEQKEPRTSPESLDRLSARDRAYGLLSSLTKLGTSWDNSEAWFALARAYEESGEPEKARDALWWVVELEEKSPVRGWRVLGSGYSV